MRKVALALTLAACVAAGCGGQTVTETSSAAAQLQGQVAGIRAAAEAGELGTAYQLLTKLRDSVMALEAAHQLSDARGATILAAADDVLQQLTQVTTTTTSTTTPPTVEPKPPEKDHPHGGDGGGPGGGKGGGD